MATSEDHESTDRIHEIERRCDELEKRFICKHEAAAIVKAEITKRTTTTEMQREEFGFGEAEQQHTIETAGHREEKWMAEKKNSYLS